MEKDFNIYEIMLELAEDENEELKTENTLLANYCRFLEMENKKLVRDFNSLFDIKRRKN